MKHPIVVWPESVLVHPAEPVPESEFGTEKLDRLIADMFETMYAAPGVGLAAPQIGIPWRLAVLDSTSHENGRTMVLVNPVITERGKLIDFEEGCLSVPGEHHPTQRHESVTVEYLTPKGEKQSFSTGGFTAIVIQHECDHLDGRLYVDQLSNLKRDLIRKKMKKVRASRGAKKGG